MAETVSPTLDQVLAFCAEQPVERVFLEDIARRGLGRFSAVAGGDGRLAALCHVGANIVPSGSGCAEFADAAAGETGVRAARLFDLDLLVPACAEAHREEIGIDPLRRDAEGFRWRTRQQIEEGRSWLWVEEGVILFKAEASAWTPAAVQLQQVWVDPRARRQGYARRALRDLCRLLLEQVPAVCLFVRPENDPALRLYDSIGMTRELTYRSLVF
jgi:ribosomal protein S18 acetylase RimI-like enzyme